MPEAAVDSIADLLLRRQQFNSKPGARKDGRKIVLAIEGGGMRGVISGAMVAALEQLNLLEAFDAVYGSSAGAVAGAYFVAGQARYGSTIFYDKINNRQFIDPWRFLVGQPMLSLEFLLDHVCKYERPLAVKSVLQSPISLNLVSSSLSKLSAVSLSGFEDAESLFTGLRCSARVPFFAGPPVEFRGDRFLDASIYESIPLSSAIKGGATDIVALMTRPAGLVRGKSDWIDRKIIAPYLSRIHPDLAAHYLSRSAQYDKELELIRSGVGFGANVCILPIQICFDDPKIHPFEKSRSRLVEGAIAGFRAVYRALHIDVPEFVETITPISRVT